MMEIQMDILATIRMQEAALFALLETVRKAIKTIQPTSPKEAANQTRTALSGDERQLMNQVLAELGVQFNSVDIFEKVKK